MSEQSQRERTIEQEASILQLSFQTHHAWLKHYDNLLVTITTFVAGIILGFFALNVQHYDFTGSNLGTKRVLESITLSLLVSFSTSISFVMLFQVRAAWSRVAAIENALGFYDVFELLDGKSIFPKSMAKTPNSVPTFFKLAFIIQVILFCMVWLHPFV